MSRIMNFRLFYNDLNLARKQRGIAWNKVATRAGVTPSGLGVFVRQFEDENTPPRTLSVENLVKLLTWMSKTDLGPYLVDEAEYDDVLRKN